MLHKSLFNLNEGQVALFKGTQLKIFSLLKFILDVNDRFTAPESGTASTVLVVLICWDRGIDDRKVDDHTIVRKSRRINEHGNDLDIPAAKL